MIAGEARAQDGAETRARPLVVQASHSQVDDRSRHPTRLTGSHEGAPGEEEHIELMRGPGALDELGADNIHRTHVVRSRANGPLPKRLIRLRRLRDAMSQPDGATARFDTVTGRTARPSTRAPDQLETRPREERDGTAFASRDVSTEASRDQTIQPGEL
jgi:hypothetical protein